MHKISKSFLIWIIVILALTNISIVGTIVNRVYFQDNRVQNNKLDPIDIPESHLGRFFRDALDLTYDQHQEFRNFRQNFHEQANVITLKMQVKRNQIINELGKENSDKIYLDSLAHEIGYLHTELKHLTFEYYLEMKNVCTPEQTEKLFHIFKAMINQEIEMKIPVKKQNISQ